MAHLSLIALDLLLALGAIQPPNGTILGRSSILLPLPVLLVDLDQPIVIRTLVGALIPPLGHPLASRLIVDRLLAPLFIRQLRTGPRVELPDALLPRKQLPFRGRLGLGQGFVAREGGRRRRKSQQHACLRVAGDGAGG